MKSSWSLAFIILNLSRICYGLNNCPTIPIRSVIQRAAETTKDAVTQMQMIRRILEDIYGGTWGVLVIRDPALVSKDVHWTFPDHNNLDGSPAFCLTVVNEWQYNVFKTGQIDSPQRVTIDNMIQRFSSGTLPKIGKLVNGKSKAKFLDLNAMKQVPRRYSIAQLDRMLSNVLEEKQRIRHNRSPKLVN
ncbi:uncharacterized protein CELE_C54D10.9 [Caenorhabditis elegans]|uniref:Uncharacterized protein n=1 Tax=Caenorhabditis elegans TaxID=6239 RepID=Q18829_CAEEL|nr:Uncharacterized protein CELE_C54D10.9 [Caenorhabditis elegans]CAA99801.1 Uncharacterized protein CELE_C54D10.9 [Caenorhabditis elegans]|eukprot:NP_506122.1 Uncharacterized protein CELE_C54D10.9 [Caenorhabditis elegans]